MPEELHDATIMGNSQRICKLWRQSLSCQDFPTHRSPVDNFKNLLMLLE